MTAISYADVFELENGQNEAETISAGDAVRTGPNLQPHYRVIAVHAEKAWLRNIESEQDALVPLARCRRVSIAV